MSACSGRRDVDRHFEGRIGPEDERAMRVHLGACASCHAYYRRRLLHAKLDPAALSAEERIGRGLGLARRPNGTARIYPFAAAAFAAAAALMLFLRAPQAADDGFHPRGPGAVFDAGAAVHVYRTRPGEPARLAAGSASNGDELAFAYENPEGKPWVMIFGVDEHGHVFWFHPAWTDANDDPRAVAADRSGRRVELREAIRHRFDGARLEIHALFLEHQASVREVEALVARRAAGRAELDAPGAVDRVVVLEVTP